MASTAWIDEHPETSNRSGSTHDAPPNYRPRRPHKKSREGCQNCKQRRIKCDESRPACGQCSYRRVQCHSSSMQTMSRESIVSQKSVIEPIISYLEERDFFCSPTPNLVNKRSDLLELLNHFIEPSYPWIGSPQCHKLMQQHGLQLSLTAPYLLHAILAFSANHLSFIFPSERKYKVAATFHYDTSLKAFSKRLRAATDANEADSLVGCSYLHIVLAFWNVQLVDMTNDHESMNAGGGRRLTWLRAMRGMQILWSTQDLRPHLPHSIWHSVCIESESRDNATCNVPEEGSSWTATASKALYQLCDVPFDSVLPGNLYQKPLEQLCLLMRCDIGQDKIGMFIFFISQLPYSFIQLVDQNDPRAILILCYWTALLSQIDQWWISCSAKLECRRLCKILDGIKDWRFHELLSFPSRICSC